MPSDYPVREVEVPGPVREVVTHVSRKEVVETERRVPKYEYEYVDRIVEVPRIEYVDKVVEVPRYQEVIREVKVPQYVDVPVDVVREVKVPRVNYVEQVKEVPGQMIEVPKPYTVEQKVEILRYVDTQRPVVVAQTVKPYIVEGAGVCEVDVYEYEPNCVPVDVHVVKAVKAQIQAGGVVETTHKVVSVPAAQYNTIMQQLNVHLSHAEVQKLPWLTERGQVTMLSERAEWAEPQPGVVIQGLDTRNLVNVHVDHSSRRELEINRVQMQGHGHGHGHGGLTHTHTHAHSGITHHNGNVITGGSYVPQGGYLQNVQGGYDGTNYIQQEYRQQYTHTPQQYNAHSHTQTTTHQVGRPQSYTNMGPQQFISASPPQSPHQPQIRQGQGQGNAITTYA